MDYQNQKKQGEDSKKGKNVKNKIQTVMSEQRKLEILEEEYEDLP